MDVRLWFDDMRQAGLQKNFGEYKTDQKTKDKDYNKSAEKGKERFTIYARGLDIANSHISDYWKWTTGGDGIDVAQVVNLKWLGVSGLFETIGLVHGLDYKVSFLLKTTPSGNMKGQQVNLKLTLPSNANQEKQANLPESSDAWRELEVGRFRMARELTGEMKFFMTREFTSWMDGLIIKGVEIKPI